MSILAVIQARTASQRFPKKVFGKMGDKSIIQFLHERVRGTKNVNEIIWAIPADKSDDELASRLADLRYKVFRGDEEDVLSRFYGAVCSFGNNVIVRITADCPLIAPEIIDDVIDQFFNMKMDYLATTYPQSRMPDGMDVEVFSFAALKEAYDGAHRPSDREHVTKYMWSHPDLFRVGSYQRDGKDLSHIRLCVDYPKDLEILDLVLQETNDLSFEGIISFYEQNRPRIDRLRPPIPPNEGLLKSLDKDYTSLKKKKSYSGSNKLLADALKIIPNGAQTFSKSHTQFPVGSSPLFLKKAKDCFVWDVDDNQFLDFVMGIGPVLIGHSSPIINLKIKDQMDMLMCPSLSSELEVQTAARLIELSPYKEAMVRFAKNGSDVTTGAVRVAKAFTNRDKIIAGGYHGWHDWFIASTSRHRGISSFNKDLIRSIDVFDFRRLEKSLQGHDVAALIFEPVSNKIHSREEMEHLVDLCHTYGTLVIFDECWTGFRLATFGACSYYGILPDLACFGKGCANGYPASFLIGRPEIMQLFSEVFFSSTFAGDPLGLAAINAVLDCMERNDVPSYLAKLGNQLVQGTNALLEKYDLNSIFRVEGYPQKPLLTILNKSLRNVIRSLMIQHFAENGILFVGYHALSFSHTEPGINYTLSVYETFFKEVAGVPIDSLISLVKGKIVEDIF